MRNEQINSSEAETQQAQINAAVRRTVGISTLQRLRKMVDADLAQQARNEARARQLRNAALIVAGLIAVSILVVAFVH